MVDTNPGGGLSYGVSSHRAALASAAVVVNLDQPLAVALAAGSKVTLVANPCKGVIVAPATTLTGSPVGAAVYPIAANEYGWVQTGGPPCVLVKGTPAPGAAVVAPGTVSRG